MPQSDHPEPTPDNPAADRRPPTHKGRGRDVFGDVLPDITADEREPRSPDADEESWYRENRPPHHDRL